MDSDLYYKDYFNKKYDLVFGHGMTDLMWYMRKQDPMIQKQTSAPVFKTEDLCECIEQKFHNKPYWNEYEKKFNKLYWKLKIKGKIKKLLRRN